MKAQRNPAAEPVNEEREILLAILHPATDHKDGCLFKANRNSPCQCGFAEIQHRINWALRRAKEIAIEVHGQAWKGHPREVAAIDNATVRAAACADDLRAKGWSVAVHNDYRQGGKLYTFWLVTSPGGRWLKGEGATDSEALDEIRQKLPAEGDQ
jgi:hypothetical protein